MTKNVLILLLLLTPGLLQALPKQALVPGGIAILKITEYTKDTVVQFNGKRVAIFSDNSDWYAIAGIPLSTRPGIYQFKINQNGKLAGGASVKISSKTYQEQHLQIKNKRKVDPNASDLKRIRKERARKNQAKKYWRDHYPDVDFIWPVNGEISSIFGLRRFFNGQERRPHNGLDIASAEGTPVRASADGTVIEAGDFFFSGNMVYIDHGQGIISLYAHLSRIDVTPGTELHKGDVIGAVGQTGRVTGPHLHFAVFANQTLIDPVFLLPEL